MSQPRAALLKVWSYAFSVRQGRPSGMVAVLFTDLVGSTELMARLGEAAFDELRRAHFAALAEAIERTGGEEIKNTGDGVMGPSARSSTPSAAPSPCSR